MRRPVVLLLIIGCVISWVAPVAAFATRQIKVVWVYDGDSFEALSGSHTIRVRLVGIDAPETSREKGLAGQPFSRKAQRRLIADLLNKTVVLESYGTDAYNRVLGIVYVNGRNINLAMLRDGLAEVYRGKPAEGLNLKPFREAEAAAQAARRGIWSLGPRYVSPRTWRRSHPYRPGSSR
jgi:endonuclease YncB( thermonuclease family)